MNLIEFITKIFGNKAQKDMREIQPYVERIKATYEKIDLLSDDELRAHSASLMKRIQDAVQVKKDKIKRLKSVRKYMMKLINYKKISKKHMTKS